MSDDPVMAALAAMEARLMARMNDTQERVLERLRGFDATLASHTELMRSNNTLLSMVVAAITDYGKRITDLEQKQP